MTKVINQYPNAISSKVHPTIPYFQEDTTFDLKLSTSNISWKWVARND